MRVFITGYRHYELGIFKDSQPEVKVLRDFLRQRIINLAEEGAEWFIIQGYTGIEMYAANEIIDLKEDYDIKLGVLKPFHKFDDRYNESDKINLNNILEHADFHQFIFEREYGDPAMFKAINQFVTSNTDYGLIVYDSETETNLKYIYSLMLELSEKSHYNIERIQFDDINDFINDRYDS